MLHFGRRNTLDLLQVSYLGSQKVIYCFLFWLLNMLVSQAMMDYRRWSHLAIGVVVLTSINNGSLCERYVGIQLRD